jgi:hypothetical protein
MAIEVMAMVFRARLGSPTRKAVALKLADHANEDGESIFPSVRRIAVESEISERTVIRTLNDLKAMKLLLLVEEGGKGPGSTNKYRMDLDMLRRLVPSKKADKMSPLEAKADAPKGDTVTPSKGDNGAEKGDTVSPEPPDSNREEQPPVRAPSASLLPKDIFEEFFKAYPRKHAKTEAWHVWHLVVYGKRSKTDPLKYRKVAQRATAAEVLAGAQQFAAECRKARKEEDKIPHAKTWLNAARWADYEPVNDRGISGPNVGQTAVSRQKHPVQFSAWLSWAETADRGKFNLWNVHGLAMVDHPFPPGYEAPQP